MRRTISTLFAVLLYSATLQAQGWIEFVDRTDRFIVNFPGDPVIADFSYTTEGDVQMPARSYTVENEDGYFSVTVVDYTQAPRVYEELCETLTDYVCDGNEVMSEVRGACGLELSQSDTGRDHSRRLCAG